MLHGVKTWRYRIRSRDRSISKGSSGSDHGGSVFTKVSVSESTLGHTTGSWADTQNDQAYSASKEGS